MAEAEQAAPAEEADFTAEKPAESDSSDSDDGMPPLDGYWASMLNVTKTAEPVKPQLLLKPKLDEERKGKGRGKGKKGKGGKSGYQPMGMYPGFPLDPLNPMGPQKGWKGGKGGWRSRQGANPNDIGDFIAWAQDENAGDGSRPVRERSRSPARQPASMRLESFLEWARDSREAKAEPPEPEERGGDLGSFMAWAAEPGPKEEEDAAAFPAPPPPPPPPPPAARAAPPPPPLAAKAEPEAEGERPAAAGGELIVPKELEQELRAMGDGAGASSSKRRAKSEGGSDQSDGD